MTTSTEVEKWHESTGHVSVDNPMMPKLSNVVQPFQDSKNAAPLEALARDIDTAEQEVLDMNDELVTMPDGTPVRDNELRVPFQRHSSDGRSRSRSRLRTHSQNSRVSAYSERASDHGLAAPTTSSIPIEHPQIHGPLLTYIDDLDVSHSRMEEPDALSLSVPTMTLPFLGASEEETPDAMEITQDAAAAKAESKSVHSTSNTDSASTKTDIPMKEVKEISSASSNEGERLSIMKAIQNLWTNAQQGALPSYSLVGGEVSLLMDYVGLRPLQYPLYVHRYKVVFIQLILLVPPMNIWWSIPT